MASGEQASDGVGEPEPAPAVRDRRGARAAVGAADLAAGCAAGLAIALSWLETPPREAVGAFLVTAVVVALTVGRRRHGGRGWAREGSAALLTRVATSWTLTAAGVVLFANAGAAAGAAAGLGAARLWRVGLARLGARGRRRPLRAIARRPALPRELQTVLQLRHQLRSRPQRRADRS